jgi:hypothetical protein
MWEFPRQRTLLLLKISHLFCTNKLHEFVVLRLLQTVLGYREISSRDLPNTENERGTGRNIGVFLQHQIFLSINIFDRKPSESYE